jgi:membrane-associated protease RseP (regulator of RpoE activity)
MGLEILGHNFSIDTLSAIVFVILIGIFVIVRWNNIVFQKLVYIPFTKIPLIYMALYKTKLGLEQMNKLSTKYREFVKLFGYTAIGVGFTLMLLITTTFVYMIIKLALKPIPNQPVLSFVLPLTNIPGVGYLSFWYWILVLFIIVLMHEFAHGVVARAHGIKIKSSGFAIFGIAIPLIPAAFVEPDEKELKKQSDVVQYSVFAAGPAINIFFAIILILLLPYTFLGVGAAPYESHFSEPVGVSFILTNQSLPAAQAGMKNHSIITAVNNVTVKDYTEFVGELLRVKPGEKITLTANDTDYSIVTIPNPVNNRNAFIGISVIQNEERIIPGKENSAKIFFWFKDFFKWLVGLSLGIGLINLLPLPITDGGRMFQIAVGKTVTNKERARRIWTYVGVFLLLILLLGVIISYWGKFMALF